MGAQLTITPAGEAPYVVEVGNTVTIGRTPENSVAFPKSGHVSRQHAVIRCHDGVHYQITDLGSRNGTFVNDQQVVLPTTLPNGARIRIAGNEIVFSVVEELLGDEHSDRTMAMTMDETTNRSMTVAILVCDVRGFSTISEQLPPGRVAHFIGQWFREAGNCIHQTQGVVDKFIGDAILAYWSENATEQKACEAALESTRRMVKSADGLFWPDLEEPMKVGVALHYGVVTSGNIGLVAQRDATIMGDVVNTAFRLESIMKELGQTVLCSAAFAERFADRSCFEDLGEQRLKGKSRLVRVFGCRLDGS